MMLAALCTAAACFTGLYLLADFAGVSRRPQIDLVRASTLSPIEWRQQQENLHGWYRRWLQPLTLLIGSRLRLRGASLDRAYLVQCAIDPEQLDGVQFRVIKIAGAVGGLVLGLLLAIVLGGTAFFIPLLAWAGYITPSRYLDHRRRGRQRSIQRELPEVVSMIRAFVVAGMPMERALHLISGDAGAPGILKAEIRAALGRYGLGLTIEEALQQISERTGTDDIALFVGALVQSKRMGTGLEQTLRDQEVLVRMNQRNRSTAEAARVGTKLLGVLAGIYLPEFVVLIMIPLFSGIIQRAFG
jgi:tight adherence protein C